MEGPYAVGYNHSFDKICGLRNDPSEVTDRGKSLVNELTRRYRRLTPFWLTFHTQFPMKYYFMKYDLEQLTETSYALGPRRDRCQCKAKTQSSLSALNTLFMLVTTTSPPSLSLSFQQYTELIKSGSLQKGTAIRGMADVDLILYFPPTPSLACSPTVAESPSQHNSPSSNTHFNFDLRPTTSNPWTPEK